MTVDVQSDAEVVEGFEVVVGGAVVDEVLDGFVVEVVGVVEMQDVEELAEELEEEVEEELVGELVGDVEVIEVVE